MKLPGPDHPITVNPTPGRVRVLLGGAVLADSERAVTLVEASYPAVQYIPRADADMSLLERSERTSHCPYKGDASYYSLRIQGRQVDDVVWSYETPYPAMAQIAGHLAFYPNRVDAIEITETAAASA